MRNYQCATATGNDPYNNCYMRIAWTPLLSLYSSTSSKRLSRSLSYYMHTTTHCKRSLRDEPSQSMKRRMTDICQDGSEHGNVGLHQRSPYERKMGKIIQICHKCNGESKILRIFQRKHELKGELNKKSKMGTLYLIFQ